MTRSEQESPVPETGPPGLTRRGLETDPWRAYTGTKLETADTAKASLQAPRQSSTLPVEGVMGNHQFLLQHLGRSLLSSTLRCN